MIFPRIMTRTMMHVVALIMLMASHSSLKAEDKLGQTGFQFLSVHSDARGAALAGAMTTIPANSSSLFFNPAGLARMEARFDVATSINQWIADINHNSLSAAYRPMNGDYGVFGLSITSVDYGDIQGYAVHPVSLGYVPTHILRPSALSIGLGYAKNLSDRFAIGGQVKHSSQQLDKGIYEIDDSLAVKKNMAQAFAYDFGTLFYTGFKGIAFGMNIRNFSNEISYEKENFQLPLTFTMGISMDVFEWFEYRSPDHSLQLSLDAVHPRSYPEYLNIGVEYEMQQYFYLRSGFMHNRDERNWSYGLGIHKYGLTLDYAFIPFGIFENVQMISARFSY